MCTAGGSQAANQISVDCNVCGMPTKEILSTSPISGWSQSILSTVGGSQVVGTVVGNSKGLAGDRNSG